MVCGRIPRPMRLLVLAPYPAERAPGQRYRIEQWAPHLRKGGIEVELSSFLDAKAHASLYSKGSAASKVSGVLRGVLRATSRRAQIRKADAVYVYRESSLVGSTGLESYAARRKPLVFDFDDAIWLPQEGSINERWAWLRSTSKTERICRMADEVIVGNTFLESWARRFAGRVSVLPSTVDLASYGYPRPHLATGSVVGWIGSHSTVRYLEALVPVLAETANEQPFRLLVIGADIASHPTLQIECRPWNAARESSDLREMDIGLMPLPHSQWTLGKCAMKAIQYLSLGVPAVVSPVGANVEVVIDDETGLHAESPADWKRGIVALLRDPARRQRMGAAGRATVEAKYSASVQAERLRQILMRLVPREAPSA